MYLGGFHRPHCAATAAELGPRAMYPGGFHRPHCAATAAKPGPRAMYLLRQRLGPRAMYLGGFHRPHCAATAAELGPRAMYPGGFHRPHCAATAVKPGPRAMYLGGFHRPHCAATAAKPGPRAMYLLRQQNSALAPCTSAVFTAPTASQRRQTPAPATANLATFVAHAALQPLAPVTSAVFTAPTASQRRKTPTPATANLATCIAHAALQPPAPATSRFHAPCGSWCLQTHVALTPSKASYTTNLSLPCPLSLCVPSPSQVYHVYTEDPMSTPRFVLSCLTSPCHPSSRLRTQDPLYSSPFLLPPQDRYVYG